MTEGDKFLLKQIENGKIDLFEIIEDEKIIGAIILAYFSFVLFLATLVAALFCSTRFLWFSVIIPFLLLFLAKWVGCIKEREARDEFDSFLAGSENEKISVLKKYWNHFATSSEYFYHNDYSPLGRSSSFEHPIVDEIEKVGDIKESGDYLWIGLAENLVDLMEWNYPTNNYFANREVNLLNWAEGDGLRSWRMIVFDVQSKKFLTLLDFKDKFLRIKKYIEEYSKYKFSRFADCGWVKVDIKNGRLFVTRMESLKAPGSLVETDKVKIVKLDY